MSHQQFRNRHGVAAAALAGLFASISPGAASAKSLGVERPTPSRARRVVLPLSARVLTPVSARVQASVAARVQSTEAGFILPVSAACISSPFGRRDIPDLPQIAGFHNGVDLPAPVGAPVVAVGPGTLIRVQRKGPGGLEMLVQHNGFIAIYSHLGLIAPAIADGNRTIYGGERIGTVGMSGLTLGPHLFFAMIVNDQAVDPGAYLGLVPCRQMAGQAPDMQRLPTRTYAAREPRLPPTRELARSPAGARQASLSAPN